MKTWIDSNGDTLEIGTPVTMPDPERDDMWQHSFSGNIEAFRDEQNLVTVIDGDGDCWDIEPHRLVIEVSWNTYGITDKTISP